MAFFPPPLTLRRQVAVDYYGEAMRKLSNLYHGRIPRGLRVLVFDDEMNDTLQTLVTEDNGLYTPETHTYGDGTDYNFVILPGTSDRELQQQKANLERDFNSQWLRLNEHDYNNCQCEECKGRKMFKMSPKKKQGPSKRRRSPKKRGSPKK
jgi:hypothetical protein